MRIHSDVFGRESFTNALMIAGLDHVWVEDFSVHNSRKRTRAFEVRLAAHEGRDKAGKARRPRMNAPYGGEDGKYKKAATYDEHGWWIAELFKLDANAIVGPYDGADDFHDKTSNKYMLNITKG